MAAPHNQTGSAFVLAGHSGTPIPIGLPRARFALLQHQPAVRCPSGATAVHLWPPTCYPGCTSSTDGRHRLVVRALLERATVAQQSFEKHVETEMPQGTIKKLVSERGFGFIAGEDGAEYFFHRSGTVDDFDSLRGGEHITFEVESSPKGPRASNVRVQ